SGVVRFVQVGELHVGERDIILGSNIPNYPQEKQKVLVSGKGIGEDVISFTPYHAWGPDKGTTTCPVCKYGWYNGVLYFVGDRPNWVEIKAWLLFLEKESAKREQYLKVYFIYGNENNYDKAAREYELAQLGMELQLQKVALTFVRSFADKESEVHLNRINRLAESTFMIYRRTRVINNFVNLKPTRSNFDLISAALDRSANEYFDLPRLNH
ncbi:MAG: intradiol ring-cleavage dioxygenase, partial [Bacteroidia bacterium]